MILNLLEIIIVILPILLSVAFITIKERKVMANIQRRVGPNNVGYFGTCQPIADAIKLFIKEQILPQHSNKFLFVSSPLFTLFVSLLGWSVIPFGQGISFSGFNHSILFILSVSAVSIYGTLFSGWSAYSKYAFLGSIRATAQMISYELVFTTCVLIVILCSSSLNLEVIIENQIAIWNLFGLIPIFMLFFISILAETNRTPFDLTEAESELVSGFFTEHSSFIFVGFFLAEYSSILLMSTFLIILFFGGYLGTELWINETYFNFQSCFLGIKTCFVVFGFIWVRATFPRFRYDQLMTFCWSKLLVIVMGFILFYISVFIGFNISSYLD